MSVVAGLIAIVDDERFVDDLNGCFVCQICRDTKILKKMYCFCDFCKNNEIIRMFLVFFLGSDTITNNMFWNEKCYLVLMI